LTASEISPTLELPFVFLLFRIPPERSYEDEGSC
jgi:hypothetical protein